MSFMPRTAALAFAPIGLRQAFHDALVRRGFAISDPDRLHLLRPMNVEGGEGQIAVSPLDEFAPIGSRSQWGDDPIVRAFVDEFAVSLRWDLYRERLFGAGVPADAPSDAASELLSRDDWDAMAIDFGTDRAIGGGRVFRRLRIYESRASARDWGAVIKAAGAPLLNANWQRDDLVVPAPRAPRAPADVPDGADKGPPSTDGRGEERRARPGRPTRRNEIRAAFIKLFGDGIKGRKTEIYDAIREEITGNKKPSPMLKDEAIRRAIQTL